MSWSCPTSPWLIRDAKRDSPALRHDVVPSRELAVHEEPALNRETGPGAERTPQVVHRMDAGTRPKPEALLNPQLAASREVPRPAVRRLRRGEIGIDRTSNR